MGIFPFIPSSASVTVKSAEELPVYKEMAYDFVRKEFATIGGHYYYVEKNEALRIWVYFALKTKRYRYLAYTRKYGSELEKVIGAYTNYQIVNSEVKRLIRDTLLVNPYINDVDNFMFTNEGSVCTAEFRVVTIYGELYTRWEGNT